MSRVGLKPIKFDSNVTVTIENGGRFGYRLVKATGPKGELSLDVQRGVEIVIKDNEITLTRKNDLKQNRAYHGLYRSLINNLIEGVSKGFEKELRIEGVGYRANMKGTSLELHLGYNHPIIVEAPEGISFSVEKEVELKIMGINKEEVGNTAAKIREIKKPEPYKGKGIRYKGEFVRRKAGKTGA